MVPPRSYAGIVHPHREPPPAYTPTIDLVVVGVGGAHCHRRRMSCRDSLLPTAMMVPPRSYADIVQGAPKAPNREPKPLPFLSRAVQAHHPRSIKT